MKSKMKLNNCLMILMAALFLLSLSVPVLAQQGRPFDPDPPHDGIWSQLTEEQRQMIQTTIQDMREEGAERAEIRAAVIALLEGWGFEVPENWRLPIPQRPRPEQDPVWSQLTEEQQETLRTTIRNMTEAGDSSEEIHAAVVALLEGWGIDVPADWRPRPRRNARQGQNPIWDQLTEEQRQEILSTLSSLHESEASREEVIETIEALFDSYDVELPEGWLPRFLRHLHHRHVWHSIMDQLTDEQKQELHELIRDQRQAGATREEIHQSVRALLESYGIELPADWEIGYDDDRFGDREKPSPRRRAQRKINNISNHPNPFNPDTRIVYTLESPEYVTLRIFNLQGQLIRTLVSQHQSAGNYSAYWDGNNQNGDPMVSGHYLYQIQAGNEIRSGRMILMK